MSQTNAPARSSGRLESLDQFRGYTVAGMLVVNFLGGLAATPAVLKHHNTYYSYADSIMPSFLFLCGVSYRLSVLRRLERVGWPETRSHAVRRSLALILVSLAVFGFNESFGSWEQMTGEGVREFVAKLLKANLWEVLAIIGAAQLLILPVIARGPRVRLAAIVALAVGHVLLSALFNYDFVHGRSSLLDGLWGAVKTRSWDGGPFGLLTWSIPMLAGSLAYDVWATRSTRSTLATFLGTGLMLMVLGYGLSCLTRLYDLAEGVSPPPGNIAESPVLPPLSRISGRDLSSLLAEPPLVPPPPERPANYWRMDKRIVSVSFIAFATGVALVLHALFIVVCDLRGLRLGLFGTFGRNPLAAYVIHHAVENTVHQVVPRDAPLWWCLLGLVVFFVVSYQFVRFLEKRAIYIAV